MRAFGILRVVLLAVYIYRLLEPDVAVNYETIVRSFEAVGQFPTGTQSSAGGGWSVASGTPTLDD